jgi:hypothetical protein
MLSAFAFPTSARYWLSRIVPLPCITLVMTMCALFLALPNIYAADWPSGVFSLTPPSKPINSAVLTNPSVAGIVIRGKWQDVEQSEGVYNWSYFDSEIARAQSAGKKILLRITKGGTNTPQWVFNAGVQTFSFVDTDPYSITYNQTITMPVYWDLIFHQKVLNLITAMGRHFATNPNIVLVSATCANGTSDDWQVPSKKVDVQNWKALGYTSNKLINVCNDIVDTTMAAFPNQFVFLAVGQSSNNLDPNPNYVANAVVSEAQAMYFGRFIVQKNSLSADTPDPAVLPALGAWQILYNNQPGVAGQMLWSVTNDSTCYMNGKVKPCDPATVLQEAVTIGAHYGMQYQEIYQQDILNPALAGVISYAADLLKP